MADFFFREAYVEFPESAARWLLQPALGPRWRRGALENRKTLKRLHFKDSRSINNYILGKFVKAEYELTTEKNWYKIIYVSLWKTTNLAWLSLFWRVRAAEWNKSEVSLKVKRLWVDKNWQNIFTIVSSQKGSIVLYLFEYWERKCFYFPFLGRWSFFEIDKSQLTIWANQKNVEEIQIFQIISCENLKGDFIRCFRKCFMF